MAMVGFLMVSLASSAAAISSSKHTPRQDSIAIEDSIAIKNYTQYVNPFIGTTNFGTTNPGAVRPNGLMSVSPFNVAGSKENKYDKDTRWWSTPYDSTNSYFTGFSHVNLSGVGCPDLGSVLVMPTSGELRLDYHDYGSEYKDEITHPGYYSNYLTKYSIKTEVSATLRSSIERYTFPKGENHIILNLSEGLTNESGAMLKKVSDTEVEGYKMMGTFCYNPAAVFPMYFVLRVSKVPDEFGYWKRQQVMSAEAAWSKYSGKIKRYTNYAKELSGDDIGAYFTFNSEKEEIIEVQVGVSFVSMENARENLHSEQPTFDFEKVKKQSTNSWNEALSRVEVEGGSADQKTIFYTALYHTLIHPNILQDYNGEYPAMGSNKILHTDHNRYTVFSLWDTYRNLHPLMSLLYPEKQLGMVNSVINMSLESGWLPKWELYGKETYTMDGDPVVPMIVDTWMRGLRDFDVQAAYKAMLRSTNNPSSNNPIRPDNDDYLKLGYVPYRLEFDNSVSHALEYNLADYNLSLLAKDLGDNDIASELYKRSLGYKYYYSEDYGTLRPRLADGKFYSPFDPLQGENFEPSPGFHEGNAWNYTFSVPFDIKGLSKLMGGKKKFIKSLQNVFDNGLYDPANEPDIIYPYLFNNFKGEEWRTQKTVQNIIAKYYKNAPDGIPGNDDTGTMSAWLVFSMMGLYPNCPGEPYYTLTTPAFDKITLHLNPIYYPNEKIEIIKTKNNRINSREKSAESVILKGVNTEYINRILIDGRNIRNYKISHKEFTSGKQLIFKTFKK